MACRVGISKYPYSRIHHWKKEEGHTSGTVLANELTYSEAQTREKSEATTRGCHSSPGGDPGDDRDRRVWSVYMVSGGKIK